MTTETMLETKKKTTMTVFMMRHGERLDEANRRQKTGDGASREDKLGTGRVDSSLSGWLFSWRSHMWVLVVQNVLL
jgi:hypothetical protein